MIAETSSHGGKQAQRLLRLYHLYRLSIGITLVLLISSNVDNRLLTSANDDLLRSGSWLYLVLNILLVVFFENTRRPAQLFSLALLDVMLLCCLFYAGGGVASAIGNLLIVSVAISNTLLRRRIGLLIAAIGALGIVGSSFLLNLSHPPSPNDYLQVGTLGALCFAAALLVQGLIRRVEVSETLAEQKASEIVGLEALNALILQRMRTGILVLDEQRRVQLANHSALSLLGSSRLEGCLIDDHFPALVERLHLWLSNPTLRPQSLRIANSGVELQPSFIALDPSPHHQTLVFLEDLAQIAQQAQQLKLAALGRLTAGIAHEIRNPLGAISHAAQLLRESEELNSADQRLTQIIQDHSQRMNRVIENVLHLSRRQQTVAQRLNLKPWLQQFVTEIREGATEHQQIHLHIAAGDFKTLMDPNQLNQILDNLIRNAWRHSAQNHDQAQVWLELFIDPDSQLPILEILDDGPGVAPDHQAQLFEPFFTTSHQGTGLGLYLSRELCESNQARLDFKPRQGGCFRITFAHGRKQS
ncbi:PAS domain-containing sensor histidine kinase [Pseudomonas sp. PCH199]|uniref:sensor histidine kinase n=1 Tax=unclassified Pseudomonas TaxID=196821 RepID=UPI000BD13112|nr:MULTISPECIES: ATP-binding protein [unclassified Pseudomonas]MCW8275814.1 PAS domain-containing sensor histidine kinase [Pseudomonas sp. PCH199]PAM83892.1 PAS domain-containing sensor histidine kinase [Pseudomonas sp. ERMR1:02]